MCTEKAEIVARSWRMFPPELGAGDPAVSWPLVSSVSGDVTRRQIAELSEAVPEGLEKPRGGAHPSNACVPSGVMAVEASNVLGQLPKPGEGEWGGRGRGWREDWGGQSSCGHR